MFYSLQFFLTFVGVFHYYTPKNLLKYIFLSWVTCTSQVSSSKALERESQVNNAAAPTLWPAWCFVAAGSDEMTSRIHARTSTYNYSPSSLHWAHLYLLIALGLQVQVRCRLIALTMQGCVNTSFRVRLGFYRSNCLLIQLECWLMDQTSHCFTTWNHRNISVK